jgi:hypothetical protein
VGDGAMATGDDDPFGPSHALNVLSVTNDAAKNAAVFTVTPFTGAICRKGNSLHLWYHKYKMTASLTVPIPIASFACSSRDANASPAGCLTG